MLTRRAVVVASLFLVPLLAAEPAAPPANEALIAQLTARSTRNRIRRETKKPEQPVYAMTGDLADPAPGGAIATAQAFLETYGSVLGLPPAIKIGGDALVVLHDEKRENGHDLIVAPARNGVPYVSGSLSFTFGKGGKLVGVNGRYRSLDDARPGKLDAARAAQRALEAMAEELPGSYLSADGTVVEFYAAAEGGGLEHQYAVDLPLGEKRFPYRVVLGPEGDLLRYEDGASAFDATGLVYQDYPGAGPMKIGDLKSAPLTDLVEPKSKSVAAPLIGKYFRPQTKAPMHAASKTGKFDYPPRLGGEINVDLLFYDPRFLEVNVYYHLMQARKHAIEVAKVPKVDIGRAMLFDSWKYPDKKNPASMNNAYYDPASKALFFPVINPGVPMKPAFFRSPAVDASVVYHEYGHHVLNVLTPGILSTVSTDGEQYQTLAIDEGFADFFADTLLGKHTIAGIFLEGMSPNRVRRVGLPGGKGMCDLILFLVAQWNEIRKRDPEKAKSYVADPHIGGMIFAALCTDLTPYFRERTLELVCQALAKSKPRTFRKFAVEFEALVEDDLTNDQWKQLDDLFVARHIFDDACPLPENPLPKKKGNK